MTSGHKSLRIAFMGTPDFAVPALKALHAAGHEIVAVYSQPPRRAGRGKKLSPSPVHRVAEELGIEVRTPISLKSEEERAAFAALDLDVAIVAAYGLILPQAILDAPKMGCLNIHGSLLPRWRGAAPVQRAILAGDTKTGITIMQMEAGLDTGPMLLKKATLVDGKTAGRLTEELAKTGADLMVQYLASPSTHAAEAQDDALATYAKKIEKQEARLNFAQSAEQVERQIRAFTPVPGAFFEFENNRYKILEAQVSDAAGTSGKTLDDQLLIGCDSGSIQPMIIQKAGKPAMDLKSFLNGTKIPQGTKLQ